MIAWASALYQTVVNHPLTDFLIGVALTFASVMEVESIIVSDLSLIEGEHGMLLYGVVQVLRTLPKLKKQILDTLGLTRQLQEKATRI